MQKVTCKTKLLYLSHHRNFSSGRSSSSSGTQKTFFSSSIKFVSRHFTEARSLTMNNQKWQEDLIFNTMKPWAGPGSYWGTLLLIDSWVMKKSKGLKKLTHYNWNLDDLVLIMSISLARIMPATTELLTITFLKEEGFKSHLKSRGNYFPVLRQGAVSTVVGMGW